MGIIPTSHTIPRYFRVQLYLVEIYNYFEKHVTAVCPTTFLHDIIDLIYLIDLKS